MLTLAICTFLICSLSQVFYRFYQGSVKRVIFAYKCGINRDEVTWMIEVKSATRFIGPIS